MRKTPKMLLFSILISLVFAACEDKKDPAAAGEGDKGAAADAATPPAEKPGEADGQTEAPPAEKPKEEKPVVEGPADCAGFFPIAQEQCRLEMAKGQNVGCQATLLLGTTLYEFSQGEGIPKTIADRGEEAVASFMDNMCKSEGKKAVEAVAKAKAMPDAAWGPNCTAAMERFEVTCVKPLGTKETDMQCDALIKLRMAQNAEDLAVHEDFCGNWLK